MSEEGRGQREVREKEGRGRHKTEEVREEEGGGRQRAEGCGTGGRGRKKGRQGRGQREVGEEEGGKAEDRGE